MQKANVCEAVCEVLLLRDIYSSKINAGSGERIVNIDHSVLVLRSIFGYLLRKGQILWCCVHGG